MAEFYIQELDRSLLRAARKLVWRVFPWQSPVERLSFLAIANRDSPLMRRAMAWAGISDILGFWGAIDSNTKEVLGTTGLYQYNRDAEEAVWLAWFCVAPEARRSGIGSRLLDFSIEEARRSERRYLRLYTSDSRNEAAAQRLYEIRGLKVVVSKNRILYTTLYRELALSAPER
jgi:GNAT superfamily N-acetyltransferase